MLGEYEIGVKNPEQVQITKMERENTPSSFRWLSGGGGVGPTQAFLNNL